MLEHLSVVGPAPSACCRSHTPFPFSRTVPVRTCRSLPHVEHDVQDATLGYGDMRTLVLANATTSNNGGACTECVLLPFTHAVSVLTVPVLTHRSRSHAPSRFSCTLPAHTSRSLPHIEYDCSTAYPTIRGRVHISFGLAWNVEQ
jgi:hypothetical protein